MIDEELERYRPWLGPVECPQKLLSGRDHPFVAMDAKLTDVEESVLLTMPSKDLVR